MIVRIVSALHRGKPGYEGCRIWLPTNRYGIENAFEMARVAEGGAYTLQQFEDCPAFLRNALILAGDMTLEEVNLLACKVNQMEENQLNTYEGMIKLCGDNDLVHPMTIRELINAAYNLDCYAFYPGVTDDQMLGEICLQENLLDGLEKLPDEAYKLLDVKKVGAELRQRDGGCFTSNGYVCRSSSEETQFYDGVHLPEQAESHEGLISLRLKSPNCHSEDGVWLELPAGEQVMRQVLALLGEPSFDSCRIAECESILPSFDYQYAGDEDIEKLNLLAGRLAEFPGRNTLMKYKAVLSLEDYPGLERMLDITRNLDCYDYVAGIINSADYAEYLLRKKGVDTGDRAFSAFDFAGYGMRQLERDGVTATPYGMVVRNGNPFVQEFTEPGQEQTMV